MKAFSDLLDRLIYTRSRNTKLRLIGDYLRATPDPDRGWALAALTGDLDLPGIKPAVIRALVEERVDPVLYRMSRDFVGDSAETIALLWPAREGATLDLSVGAIVERLRTLGKSEAPAALAAMLDALDENERFALLKMATGALRVGVTARLAKTATMLPNGNGMAFACRSYASPGKPASIAGAATMSPAASLTSPMR
jgi:DNA ligase-1